MIYLDNAATTKPSKDAINKATIFNEEEYFNPSALYRGGLAVNRQIKEAKQTIISALSANPDNFDVVFTSCGSESDNTAVFCVKKRGLFVTTKGEHSAIYQSFLELKNRGVDIYLAELNADGTVNVDSLLDFIKVNKVDFVSIVHVNNETGGINDVNYIAKEVKKINPSIIFHSDGVQAFGKIQYSISDDIDLYSISAHKINGIKGVGALIKKKRLNVSPLIFGGGQEGGLRSGTENVFGIKVFQFVTQDKKENLEENIKKVANLRQVLLDNLDLNLFKVISGDNSSPYILMVSAIGLRGEVLMHFLEDEGVILGNGSACSSKNRYSRIVKECGYKNDVLDGLIRISFSPYNTVEEVLIATRLLNTKAKILKGVMK